MMRLSRRAWLHLAGGGSLLAGTVFGRQRSSDAQERAGTQLHSAHAMGTVGRVGTERFNPMAYLRTANFSQLAPAERSQFYRETPRPDGSLLREYDFVAIDRELEIAPGVYYPAWTYNGQVPGPTIRATEGDRVRVNFLNQGTHPHSIHFHGWHPPDMDGAFASQQVRPGERFTYEFDAQPFGLHLYHCHTPPLKRHIHKGLYGVFIVDPREPRPLADELVMVMNGFDTNFDADNEIYAVNTIANYFVHEPIRVTVGRLVRIYLVNVTEFDLLNSFHLHGMFFDVYRTGTSRTPHDHTDTVMLCQGERAILETTFRYPGEFMFHAHQSEFAELGWMGTFVAAENPRET